MTLPRSRIGIGLPALCVALGTWGIGGAARAAGTPVRIELRNEAIVSKPHVRLGDIAILTTRDAPTLERLMELPLGAAPRTGTAIRIDRDRLLRWVRARTGLGADEIEWAGARFALVRSAVESVPGTTIAERAERALSETLAAGGLRAEIRPPVVPRDVNVPAGTLEIRVRSLPRASLLSRRPSVWVDLWVDGRFVRAVPVTFDLNVLGPAGNTRAGSGPAAVLQRGSWATLREQEGLVSLEHRVEVLEEGREGQAVRVRAAGSRKVILARITGPDSVEVER